MIASQPSEWMLLQQKSVRMVLIGSAV